MVYNYLATNYAFVSIFFERKIGEGQLTPTGRSIKKTNYNSNNIYKRTTDHMCISCRSLALYNEFCYGVYNQRESFIYLDLMIKNRELLIESYFNWLTSTKLVYI
jgi:hypothetical protein